MTFLEKQVKRIIKTIEVKVNDNDIIISKLPKTMIKVISIRDLGVKDDMFVKRVIYTKYSDISYNELVNGLVSERYTIQDELAIQRKAYNGLTDEFHVYNAYVEECKIKAKQFIAEREGALNDTNR